MRARYGIYPHDQYLLETFSGALRYEHLKQFVQRQQGDVRIEPHFHTLSDFSKATLHLSLDEAKSLVALVCSTADMRTGRRALVIVGARNFGFVDVFKSGLETAGIVSKCFSHRDAALVWLGETCRRVKFLMPTESDVLSQGILQTPLDLECQGQ